MHDIESRVTDLEIQISHQSKMLDELNTVIIFQQKTLAKIEKVNNAIIENLKDSYENYNGSFSTDSEQKPPHN